MEILTTVYGLSVLLMVGGAYFYGHSKGKKEGRAEIQLEVEEERRKDDALQNRVFHEIEVELEKVHKENELLRERLHQNEIESIQSPDRDDPALSAERMRRIRSIGAASGV